MEGIHPEEDICAPGCQRPRVALGCPRNGERIECYVTDSTHGYHPHRVEELVVAGRRMKCSLHDIPLELI